MKRIFLLLGSMLLILTLGAAILIVSRNSHYESIPTENTDVTLETSEFSLDLLTEKYQWLFDAFPVNENIGIITTAEIAAQKAKTFLLNRFSGIAADDECFNPKWVKVDYDSQKDCWHIYNTTPRDMAGGVVHVFVYSNGDVISAFIED